jgi:hypothetical protein
VLTGPELAAFDSAYRETSLPDVAALNAMPSLSPPAGGPRGIRP